MYYHPEEATERRKPGPGMFLEAEADHNLHLLDCLMIGDAQADLDAAVANQVPFLLRRHSCNTKVFAAYTGTSVEDFTTL